MDEGITLEDMPEYALVCAKMQAHVEDCVSKTATESERLAAFRWLFSDDVAPMSAQWCADIMSVDLAVIRDSVQIQPRSIRAALCYRRGRSAAA